MTTLEALNQSLEDAKKELIEKQKSTEEIKDVNKEVNKAGPKSENDKPENEPYTIEDLRKLKEEKKEKAFEKVDEKKLEPELLEKYKLLQGMATRRQQFIAAKEQELDKALKEKREIIQELNKLKNALVEKSKEISSYDDDFKKIYDEIENKLKESQKYDNEEAAMNWRNAELAVREQFPEFGIFSEEEMTKTLQENKRLLELAMVDNGRFGDIVLSAAHILTMLKPENFKKIILGELEGKPDVYKDVIEHIIQKKIKEYEEKEEKKKSFSDLQEKNEVETNKTIPPNKKKAGKGNIADLLKEAATKIMENA